MIAKQILIRDWVGFKRIAGLRVAFTVGIFDGIHKGHLSLFSVVREVAADISGIPLIFTFENHPLTVLQPEREIRYLTLPEEKLYLLRRLGFQHVACFRFTKELSQMSAAEFISRLKDYCDVRALVVGYDATIGHDRLSTDPQFSRLARELGFEFIRIEQVMEEGAPVSSKRIRQDVERGDLISANKSLVYPFFVRGRVSRGRGIGEKLLKVPTANIELPREKIMPPPGVYAGSFRRDSTHTATALFVAEAGWQPRFYEQGLEPGAEAEGKQVPKQGESPEEKPKGGKVLEGHVIGKRISIRGAVAEFIFFEKLRDLEEFDEPQKLKERILADIHESVRSFEKHRLRLRFLP